MPLYMFQFAYTPESWAAQIKHPENRIERVGKAAAEAAGAKFVGGWLSTGEFDAMILVEAPDVEAVAGFSIAISAGGAVRNARTTALMSGEQGIEALKKAAAVAKVYKPAR